MNRSTWLSRHVSSRLVRRARGGYAMLIALLLLAILTIIGSTSLSIAGVDQRVAIQNQRHMIVVGAAEAGTNHARYQLESELPANEGWDTGSEPFVNMDGSDGGEAMFAGANFPVNQGTYEVKAVYVKCGPPPPGYSTEAGRQSFRSDYWDMQSRAIFRDGATLSQLNPIEATVITTLRRVTQGPCKIR
jgi:hypothetical protein